MNKDRLSRKGIHEEVFKRFDYAPKTIDNTLQRLVQGKAPQVVRKGKGFYALSPKELYRGCLLEGEEWNQTRERMQCHSAYYPSIAREETRG
jgi:hypothetical protein